MSDTSTNDGGTNTNVTPQTDTKPTIDTAAPEFKAALQAAIDVALADIKPKLDNAYKARDDLQAKLAEREQADREAHLKALKDAGKDKEAFELQLGEERAQKLALTKRVTELTRDVDVQNALAGYAFRNDIAADMARKTIVEQLVQKEDGSWVHRSGVSIKDFVDSFAASEEQSFLFKPKMNAGGGTVPLSGAPATSSTGKSLFERTQQEVLEMAAKGQLGHTRRF